MIGRLGSQKHETVKPDDETYDGYDNYVTGDGDKNVQRSFRTAKPGKNPIQQRRREDAKMKIGIQHRNLIWRHPPVGAVPTA